MLEVFTVGGGDYLVNTFNAIAAWTGSGGFRALVRVSMVLGLLYALLVTALDLDWRVWIRWFLQSTLIYLCLMVPTVTVKVTDRMDPGLAPATVANVPLGLGVMASFTSQLSDWFTRTAETVFVTPAQLSYSNGGFVYGARLWDKARSFEIRNPVFKANLDGFLKQCVYYDILYGTKSLKLLSESTDLWAEMGVNAATNRGMKYLVDTGGGTVDVEGKTCQQAWADLDGHWTSEIEAYALPFAKSLYPKLPAAAAASKLANDLPVVSQLLTGSAQPRNAFLRQKSVIDAFEAAQVDFGNADADAFALQRADTQARNAMSTAAEQGMIWVPVLQVVLATIFYALFPIIFPLFLFPRTGIPALKGYFVGFFYLAAWGPLYVLIHSFIMDRLVAQTNAIAAGGPRLVDWAGIDAVNQDIATMAGYLILSVPLLALMVVRGTMAVANSASGFLSAAQSAGDAASVERTTGNYTYGDVSYANLNHNNRQEAQWNMAPSLTTGAARVMARSSDGVTETGYGNGRSIYDTSGAISQLPFKANWNASQTADMRRSGQWYLNEADRLEAGLSRTHSDAHSVTSGTTNTEFSNSGSRWEKGKRNSATVDHRTSEGVDTSQGVNVGSSIGQQGRFSQSSSNTQSDTGTWKLGGEVGLLGNIPLAGGGSRGSKGNGEDDSGSDGGRSSSLDLTGRGFAGYDRNWADQDSKSKGASYDVTAGQSVSTDKSVKASQGLSTTTSLQNGSFSQSSQYGDSGSSQIRSKGSEDRATDATETRNTVARYREIGERMVNEANYAESRGFALSSDMSNLIQDRYEEYRRNNPELHLPEIQNPNLTLGELQRRDQMVSFVMDDLLSDLREKRTYELADVAPITGAPSLSQSPIRAASAVKPGSALNLGGPVDTTLPRSGEGFLSYARSSRQVGTSGFVGELQALGERWSGSGHAPIAFGEISKAGGGDISGHDAHEKGREVDVRPFRLDGGSGPVTWKDGQYDQGATRDFVTMVREQHPRAVILFNDPQLIEEGLTRHHKRHDNHLHVQM